MQHAKVFVSVMGSQKDAKLTLHGLDSAAGFVQSKLAKRLATRFVPHVTSCWMRESRRPPRWPGCSKEANLGRKRRGDGG